MQTSVLGTISLDVSPFHITPTTKQTPTYRGISRRQKPSELAIDQARTPDAVAAAVITHVERLYRNAPYLEKGDLNSHLASIVSLSVWRSLTGSLTAPNGSVPLSNYVNMLSRSRHLDEIRKHSARRQHEVLTRDLAHQYPDDLEGDLLTFISDNHVGKEYRGERQLALEQFLGTVTGKPRLSAVIRQAERWGARRRPIVPVPPRVHCECFNCNRPAIRSLTKADLPAKK
jgi:hypothetical protein